MTEIRETMTSDPRALSSREWAAAGVGHVAYIRPVVVEGGNHAFGIFAADGTPLSVASSAGAAVALIRTHDLEPASVH